MLDEKELAVMDKIDEAHTLFLNLTKQHPQEYSEWVSFIHQLQNLILIRPTIRSHGWTK